MTTTDLRIAQSELEQGRTLVAYWSETYDCVAYRTDGSREGITRDGNPGKPSSADGRT